MICDDAEKLDIRTLARKVPTLPDVIEFEGERIVIAWTAVNFGGQRPWFLCPSCDRRCAIIYRKGDGPLWGCRICMNGRYETEHLSKRDRLLRKAFTARHRLGQKSGGVVVPFPQKPKHMHWATYERIRWKSLKLESEIWAIAKRRLGIDDQK